MIENSSLNWFWPIQPLNEINKRNVSLSEIIEQIGNHVSLPPSSHVILINFDNSAICSHIISCHSLDKDKIDYTGLNEMIAPPPLDDSYQIVHR